jgi:hypothetical protein
MNLNKPFYRYAFEHHFVNFTASAPEVKPMIPTMKFKPTKGNEEKTLSMPY